MDDGAQLVLPADAIRADSCSSCSPSVRSSSQPETRRNEILSLLEQGLEDISITRSRLSWAIPFPLQLSTGEEQGTWVWFDALPNYLTATGFPDDGYDDRWPAQLHVIGKDITRLHCVDLAGDAASRRARRCPSACGRTASCCSAASGSANRPACGSTSTKRSTDTAPTRFATSCCAKSPFDADGSFSYERFDERYNADLANSLGNLASRAISMVEKYCDGVVPSGAAIDLDRADAADLAEYHAAMDGSRGYLLHEGLKRVMACVSRGNEFVQSSQPWALAKKPESRARARTRARRDHPTAGAPRDSPRAVHAEQGAGAVGAARRPGRVEDQRFDDVATLDVDRVARSERAPRCFRSPRPASA